MKSISYSIIFLQLCCELAFAQQKLQDISPINRTSPIDTSVMAGDVPKRSHDVLWDKETVISQLPNKVLPAPSEQVDYLFIGGGMGNLIAAHQILLNSKVKPRIIFIEAGDRFGGNSQAETWNGLTVSLGAAYIAPPEKGSIYEKILKQLGILSELKVKDTSKDPVFISRQDAAGKYTVSRYDNIWDNGTGPESKAQFNRVRDLFKDFYNQKNGKTYPMIPPPNAEHRKYVESLNKITFYEFLKNHLNADLHPDVERVLSSYCRSALNKGIRFINAAAVINFLVGDFGGIATFPGGNGRIAEALLEKIAKDVPLQDLRTQSTAFDIQVAKDGAQAQASYMGSDGKVRTISAKNILVGTAPFILGKLIDDIEPARTRAIHSMKYAPYVVANVLLKRNSNDKNDMGYDIIFSDPELEPIEGKDVNITDVVIGEASANSKHRILTVYIPGDEKTVHQWIRKSTKEFKEAIMAELNKKVLPSIGYTLADVEDIRIARHGHAVPLALPGNMVAPVNSEGVEIGKAVVDELATPYRERVYFVGQSTWGLPGLESIIDSTLPIVDHLVQTNKAKNLQPKNMCSAVFK